MPPYNKVKVVIGPKVGSLVPKIGQVKGSSAAGSSTYPLRDDGRCVLLPDLYLERRRGIQLPNLLRDKWTVVILLGGILFYATVTQFIVVNDQPLECYAKDLVRGLIGREVNAETARLANCSSPSGVADFYFFYMSASVFARGENAYALTTNDYVALAQKMHIPFYAGELYVYPLLTAFLVRPLLLLPIKTAAGIWILSNGLTVLLAACLLASDMKERWQQRISLIAALLFLPVLNGMYAGNNSLSMLLPVAAGIHYIRRHRDIAAGAWLAIGFWVKIVAAPLFLLLVWRARWCALLSAFAVSVALVLAFLITFGPQNTLAQTNMSSNLLNANYGGFVSESTNQNLNGLVSRWFWGPARTVRNRAEMERYSEPLINAPQLARPVYLMLAAFFGLATVALLAWPHQRLKPIHIQASLLIVTMLLVTPLSEYHHMVLALIALAVLLEQWKNWRQPDWSVVLLGIAYVGINLHAVMWKLLVPQVLLLDFGTWGLAILWVLLARELIRQPEQNPPLSAPGFRPGAEQYSGYQQNHQVSA